MRIAVLADIHGNLEALAAVLADMKVTGPNRVICLGDLVGYGPDPEAVVQQVQGLGWQCCLGNHEAALHNKRARKWLNFQARENNVRTEQLLTPASLEFCRVLPRTLHLKEALFVHGMPPDSVLNYLYLVGDEKLAAILDDLSERLVFVGHTHELQVVCLAAGVLTRSGLPLGVTSLVAGARYVVNVGSVGQPRDGDRRAKYVLWDQQAECLEVRAVAYDVEATAAKIRERGFPKAYAERLL